jgi:hypothetical protein
MRSTVLRACALSSAVLTFAAPLAAQEAAPPAASAPPVAALIEPAQSSVLRAGAEIPLLTREELTTKEKKLRVGQRFQMEVASNVMEGGVIVIPAGTPAVGEVTEVKNKGMWGKSGYISARVLSMRIGDRQVRLTGTFDDKGTAGTGAVVGALLVLPVAGFFMTGTSATIASGSAIKAFLDEDIAFRAVATPAPVLEIPVAAPAPVLEAPAAVPAVVQASVTAVN